GTLGQRGAVVLKRLEPLLVGGSAFAQAGPKQQLQPGKPVKAEMLGETHQRRGLYMGGGRDAGGGTEGNLIGMIERIGCHLRQPLGQFPLALNNDGAQRLKIFRRQVSGLGQGHGWLSSRANYNPQSGPGSKFSWKIRSGNAMSAMARGAGPRAMRRV